MADTWYGTLYESLSPEQVMGYLKSGYHWMVGKPITIAMTGMQGVGKTVLFHYLTGKVYEANYVSPLQSQAMEKGKVTKKPDGEKRRLFFNVIPGQSAAPRSDAIETVFLSETPVDVVIHVVSYGHATTRNQGAVQVLLNDEGIDTIEKYRELQLEAELKDLEETCKAIRDTHRKHRKPYHLLVAVDKIDLYHDRLAQARAYYESDSGSPFVTKLKELMTQIGTDNISWQVLPVCGHLEDFVWNEQTLHPQLNVRQRNQHIYQFLKSLETFCH